MDQQTARGSHTPTEDEPVADRAFFHVLGAVFAAMITLAATMSIMLPNSNAEPADASVVALQR